MFVHETHSFYVIVKLDNCQNAPEGYLDKKNAIFNKVLTNIGLEKVVDFDGIWQFKDVMYSASDDIFDIISNLSTLETSMPDGAMISFIVVLLNKLLICSLCCWGITELGV